MCVCVCVLFYTVCLAVKFLFKYLIAIGVLVKADFFYFLTLSSC